MEVMTMTDTVQISFKSLDTVQRNECCEHCGRVLEAKEMIMFGIVKKFRKVCKCIHEKESRDKILEEERQKNEKLKRLFKQSRLGERFKNSNFKNIIDTQYNGKAVKSLQDFAANFDKSRSFLLFSHPGTGKTLMVSAVVNELVAHGISAIFANVPDLLGQIMSSYQRNSENKEYQLLNGLNDCDCLILDDIGAEKHSNDDDWATVKLYQIINSRYNNMKSTIFTTNCNSTLLKTKIGDRSYSRIFEMCSKENIFNLDKEIDWRVGK